MSRLKEVEEQRDTLLKQRDRLMQEKAELIKRAQDSEGKPRFLVAKFTGFNPGIGRRELFDAHVIEVDTSTSFPLIGGHTNVEVTVEELT